MKTRAMLLIISALLIVGPTWAKQPPADPTPTLGADCGTGASIVGNETAGKVTLGTNDSFTCTLGFSVQSACSSVDETSCGIGHGTPIPIVTSSTPTPSAQMQFVNTGCDGDVVSYVCNPY